MTIIACYGDGSRSIWRDISTAPHDETVGLIARHDDTWGWVRGTAYWIDVRGICGWISRGLFDPPGVLGLAAPSRWIDIPPLPHDRTGSPALPWRDIATARHDRAIVFVARRDEVAGWICGTGYWSDHPDAAGWITTRAIVPPRPLGLARPCPLTLGEPEVWAPIPDLPIWSGRPIAF